MGVGFAVAEGDGVGVVDPPPPPLVAVPLRVNVFDAATPPGYSIVNVAPDSAPALTGVQARVTVHVPEAAISTEVEQVPPVTLTPVPAAVIADGVVDDPPLLVTVTVRGVDVPTVGLPKEPDENVRGPAGGVTAVCIWRCGYCPIAHVATDREPLAFVATARSEIALTGEVFNETGLDQLTPPSSLVAVQKLPS